MAIEVDTIELPAHWASALVNGDESSFDFHNNAADRANYEREVSALASEGWHVCCPDGETFIGRYRGLQTEMLTYTIHRSK